MGMMLAYTGAVKDGVLDVEELACHLIEMLWQRYPQNLKERYKMDCPRRRARLGTAGGTGQTPGLPDSGGDVDLERAAKVLLDEYRGCKIEPLYTGRPPRSTR